MTDYQTIFGGIYSTHRGGYGSGGGSCEDTAWPYERLIERLLALWQPRTVLDLGCGDGQVASRINWGNARYIGMDVTQEALDYHPRHGVQGGTIIRGDMLRDVLPDAELVLTKEATQHMTTPDILILIERLRAQGYSRVVHTSCIMDVANVNIEPGQTRTVDLLLPPFSLPVKTLLRWQCGEGGKYLTQVWEPRI